MRGAAFRAFRITRMTTDQPIPPESPTFTAIFQQNWENVRNIKSERIWFMNTYSVISAGTLSLLQSIRSEAAAMQLALIFAMCVFSVMGLLFPLFYSLAAMLFAALFAYRVATITGL